MKPTPVKLLTLLLAIALTVLSFVSCESGRVIVDVDDYSSQYLKDFYYFDDDNAFIKLELIEILEEPTYVVVSDLRLKAPKEINNEDNNDPDAPFGVGEPYLGDIKDAAGKLEAPNVSVNESIYATFRVVESVYGDIPVGTVVTSTIQLRTVKYNVDEQRITGEGMYMIEKENSIEALTLCDSIYVFLHRPPVDTVKVYDKNWDRVQISNYMGNWILLTKAFAIKDGIISSEYYELLHISAPYKHCVDYEEYFSDGMTEEELIESMQRLYREQMEEGKTE